MKLTSNNNFKKGSGCYICSMCGKTTRATGHSEENVQLCASCYERAGDENAVSDGQMSQEEFDSKWSKK
jgi:ribosome-binding protein aMBF1 (putative translation factor)